MRSVSHRTATVRRRLALAVALAALFAALPREAQAARRVVAIGDVHGAYDGLLAILQEAGLADRKGRWTGGDAVLVQTGDFFDRGADTLRVADLLMDLQADAAKAGGAVHVLLGNHEVMNLLGDLRDVNPGILARLVDARSDARRLKLCESFVEVARRRAAIAGEEAPAASKLRESCRERHPLGLVEYFETLSPQGRYGQWLRRLPPALRLGDVVFVHGGVDAVHARTPLAELDAAVKAELYAWDVTRAWLVEQHLALPTAPITEVVAVAELAQNGTVSPSPAEAAVVAHAAEGLLVSSTGPFWFRGYARWSEEEAARELPVILAGLGASHLVVGHTPQTTRAIQTRFEGQVILIDTGMLEDVYKGRPAALEIAQDAFTAVYVGARTPLEVRLARTATSPAAVAAVAAAAAPSN